MYVQPYCLKIEFSTGGNISIDGNNADCTKENESTSLSAISTFQSSNDSKAVFAGAYSGEIYFTEDASLSEITPMLKSLKKEIFLLEIVLPSCSLLLRT